MEGEHEKSFIYFNRSDLGNGILGCGMKNTVQIGTGDVNGTYYAYGTELAEILNNNSDVYFKV